MPRGPRGERRLADVIGAAVKVMQIATGEELDDREDMPAPSPAQSLGKSGGTARAKAPTPEQRNVRTAKAAPPGHYSPAQCRGATKESLDGRPDPAHVIRRAAEPEFQDGHAALHSPDERLLRPD